MPDIVWSVAGFIVAISVLVCFHEFGHYWVARTLGVKVLRFSLGFGTPFKTFVARDGVEWSIAPLPIGGYVKMLDEREGPVAPHERHLAFNNQSLAKRAAIVAAGPVFNFMLAIALYWLVFVIGTEGLKPLIAQPPAGSVAASAGLQAGDEIVAVDGEVVQTWAVLGTDLIERVLDGGNLPLTVQSKGGVPREVSLDVSKVRVDPEVLFDDLGLSPYEPMAPPVLTQILKGSPAEAAGLQEGDRVLSLDGAAINSPSQLVSWVRAHPGAIAEIEIDRGGERSKRRVVLETTQTEGKAYGRLGSGVATPPDLWQDLRAERRLDSLAAIPAAAEQTWRMSWLTLRMLGRMVIGDVSVKNVSGPIQIAQVAGDSARVGLVSFLSFMAIVSVSLGVLNLLPVPVLDGGHLLLFAIEGVKGRPLSERAMAASQYLGFAFIGTLMVLAFYNDIMRLI
ncbi:RIP metalloprotease RseP [Hydrocarboniphaga sp.]|uniref:RIP metalloprotease RseP n=1 Tax=Hydrocarboniphaga sp. TaxID=2033016 RepID=UPI003D0CFC9B